jgi:hypothetical protein
VISADGSVRAGGGLAGNSSAMLSVIGVLCRSNVKSDAHEVHEILPGLAFTARNDSAHQILNEASINI